MYQDLIDKLRAEFPNRDIKIEIFGEAETEGSIYVRDEDDCSGHGVVFGSRSYPTIDGAIAELKERV